MSYRINNDVAIPRNVSKYTSTCTSFVKSNLQFKRRKISGILKLDIMSLCC